MKGKFQLIIKQNSSENGIGCLLKEWTLFLLSRKYSSRDEEPPIGTKTEVKKTSAGEMGF